MNVPDVLIIAVVILSVAVAAAHGFFHEVFGLAGVVIGYLLAAWNYAWVARWFEPLVKTPWLANAAGFLTIFVSVVLLAGAVGKLARWGAKEAGLRWFDRVLGGVFGLLRGVLVVTVFMIAVNSWTPEAEWLSRSPIAPYLLVVGRAAVWVAPTEVRMQFREGLARFRHLKPPESGSIGGK
jgi:membrane protein required for colicin V production